MAPPLLLHVYSTFGVGGAQVRFAAIANHFGQRWRHAIVAMDGNTACRERLDPGLAMSFPDIGLHKGDTLGNIRRIRAVLREMRPRTLITSNWGSIEWAMANAVRPLAPQVHIEDGFGPEERSIQIRRRVLTRRLVLRGCTTVLPSQNLLRIASDIWRLPRKNLHYIPNGIDLARFAVQRTQTPYRAPVVGTVAALRAEKNLGRLLRAFRLATADGSVPGRLVIVGDGPERPMLEALAQQPGLLGRVDFTGHRPDPAAALAEFDIFALSSDTEQMPISLLEAMAASLPVAVTDVGDVRVMLPAESQNNITALDDEALAAALRRLLLDPAARQREGVANRGWVVQTYAETAMFAAYADLFDGGVSGA
jgi:glycosyltransferase involved in cell wall biosynthesis